MPHFCHVLVSFCVLAAMRVCAACVPVTGALSVCVRTSSTLSLCRRFGPNSTLSSLAGSQDAFILLHCFSSLFFTNLFCIYLYSFTFFLHYSHADSHKFSFIQLFVLVWHNVLINFGIYYIVIILYKLYENALWRGPLGNRAAVMIFCGLSPLFRVGL